jgi:hypothetical protein
MRNTGTLRAPEPVPVPVPMLVPGPMLVSVLVPVSVPISVPISVLICHALFHPHLSVHTSPSSPLRSHLFRRRRQGPSSSARYHHWVRHDLTPPPPNHFTLQYSLMQYSLAFSLSGIRSHSPQTDEPSKRICARCVSRWLHGRDAVWIEGAAGRGWAREPLYRWVAVGVCARVSVVAACVAVLR